MTEKFKPKTVSPTDLECCSTSSSSIETSTRSFRSDSTLTPEFSKLGFRPRFYDTTLRDGNQAIDVNFSVDDKIKIARKLSDFGMDYIEGGWPNTASPVEIEFFKRIEKEQISSSIAAFGITRKPRLNLRMIET